MEGQEVYNNDPIWIFIIVCSILILLCIITLFSHKKTRKVAKSVNMIPECETCWQRRLYKYKPIDPKWSETEEERLNNAFGLIGWEIANLTDSSYYDDLFLSIADKFENKKWNSKDMLRRDMRNLANQLSISIDI